MTYFKKIAAASALAIVFSGSSALAGDMHSKKANSDVMTKASYDTMTPEQRERKQLKMMVKSDMTEAQKEYWSTLSADEQKSWMNTAIEKQKRSMIADNSTEWNTNSMSTDSLNIEAVVTQTSSNAEMMKVNDTVGEFLQADGEPDVQTDREILMSNGDQMTKSKVTALEKDGQVKNNIIAVPTLNSNVVTTVSCPVGTTAQTDMTCLVTGDYESNS